MLRGMRIRGLEGAAIITKITGLVCLFIGTGFLARYLVSTTFTDFLRHIVASVD